MDKQLAAKERELEMLGVEEEISQKRTTIAERKALEREARRRFGPDWRKIMGMVGKAVRGMKPDMETVHDLYGVGLGGKSFRELNNPRRPQRKSLLGGGRKEEQ